MLKCKFDFSSVTFSFPPNVSLSLSLSAFLLLVIIYCVLSMRNILFEKCFALKNVIFFLCLLHAVKNFSHFFCWFCYFILFNIVPSSEAKCFVFLDEKRRFFFFLYQVQVWVLLRISNIKHDCLCAQFCLLLVWRKL